MTTISPDTVWRAPGMPVLLAMTLCGFSGYAVLLPAAPLWAAHGGAGSAGVGAVNGVLMLFTVLTQPFVPGAVRRIGWAPVMAGGLLLLGLPSLMHLFSDNLGVTLGLSAVRGVGFGILTVTGSAAVAELVEPARRGAAVGAYGLAIAVPQLLFMPAGPWVAEEIGFWVVFAVGALPVLGCLPAIVLGRHLVHDPDTSHGAEPRVKVYGRLVRPMFLLLGVTLAGGALITFSSDLAGVAWLTTTGLLLLTATAALSRWGVGGMADRFGAQRFLWPLVVLTVVGLTLIMLAISGREDTDAALLLGGMAIVGVAYGGLQNLTLVVSFEAVSRRDYGTASATWNIGFDSGTGLGAVLVGAIAAGASFSTALLVAAVISLATLPVALVGDGGKKIGSRVLK